MFLPDNITLLKCRRVLSTLAKVSPRSVMETRLITHAFSGSMNQSSSHSHPLGGIKYCCFSFSLPVTSENLWRPTSPVVPHFPNTWAWFSYCNAKRNNPLLFCADSTAGPLIRTFEPTSSANTLKVPSENELNFFSCADRPSHMLTLIWTGTFIPLFLSVGYWKSSRNKKNICQEVFSSNISFLYFECLPLKRSSVSCRSVGRRPARCTWSRGFGGRGCDCRPPSFHPAASRWSRLACCSEAGHSDGENVRTNECEISRRSVRLHLFGKNDKSCCRTTK